MKKMKLWAVMTAILMMMGVCWAQSQGDGAAGLMDQPSFLSGLVLKLAAAHPWVVAVLLVMGALRAALKPVMSVIENACAKDPLKEAKVKAFEAGRWFHWLCWLLDFAASVKVKQSIVAASGCVMLLCVLALPATAQSNGTNGPAPTIQGGVQQIIDAFKSGQTNWYIGTYGLYAPGLQKKAGGGAAFLYPLSQYVVTGARVDYVNGGFWMPSGNATLQIPLKLSTWLTVTPFGYAGVGVPVSGATISGLTLGAAPKDNNGQPTAILGYGVAADLWHATTPGTHWYSIDSIHVVVDRETWSGFTGYQYRAGLFFNKKL